MCVNLTSEVDLDYILNMRWWVRRIPSLVKTVDCWPGGCAVSSLSRLPSVSRPPCAADTQGFHAPRRSASNGDFHSVWEEVGQSRQGFARLKSSITDYILINKIFTTKMSNVHLFCVITYNNTVIHTLNIDFIKCIRWIILIFSRHLKTLIT